MIEEIGMRREVVARSLEALAAEMDRLKRAVFSAGIRALPQGPSKLDREDPEWYEAREPEEIAYEEARMRAAAARRDTLREMQQRLEGLGQVLAQDGAAWSAERETYDHLLSRMPTIPATTPAPIPPSTAPAPVAASLPLLSETIAAYLDGKRADEVSERHVDGLTRRFHTFITHTGDKPLTECRASDLQSFVSTLARVPAQWAKETAIKDVSARAAAEWNAARRNPLPTMGKGTINLGYARALRTWFSWLALEHNIPNPLGGLRLKTPKTAKESVRRKPLTVPELNQWFVHAARDRRPDDRWLPLVGLLTGARIAELVFAQGRDLRQFGDSWAIDLMTPLVDLKTKRETRRPLKNTGSARLVSLHSTLVEVGFVEWAWKTPPNGWLFPALHARVSYGPPILPASAWLEA